MNNELTQPDDDLRKYSELDGKFDKALQLWGSERTAEPAHLEQQKTKAIELLAGLPAGGAAARAENDNPKLGYSPNSKLLGIPGWAWAVAASVLIVVGLGLAMNRPSNTQIVGKSPRGVLDANALTLVSTNVEQQRLLFSRFREVFGDQIKCVSEVDGEMKVELLEGNELPLETATGDEEYISVRLVLISHKENSVDENWAVVHEMTMFAGQEYRIDVPMSGNGIDVSVWAFPVDNDLVSVDLEFKCKTPVEVGQASSLLEKTGEPKQLFTTKQNGIEYRLYQTINRINQRGDVFPVEKTGNTGNQDRSWSRQTSVSPLKRFRILANPATSEWEGCREDV